MTTDGDGCYLHQQVVPVLQVREIRLLLLIKVNLFAKVYQANLSQDASSVMLANGSSGNKTQNKIISTDDKPINVFASSSTSYMGAGIFHCYNGAYSSFSTNSGSNWQWNYGCGTYWSMTAWLFYITYVEMQVVLILFNQSTSVGRNWNTGQWYSAWIR